MNLAVQVSMPSLMGSGVPVGSTRIWVSGVASGPLQRPLVDLPGTGYCMEADQKSTVTTMENDVDSRFVVLLINHNYHHPRKVIIVT